MSNLQIWAHVYYYLHSKISSSFTHPTHTDTKPKRLKYLYFIKSPCNYFLLYLLPIQLFSTFTNYNTKVTLKMNFFWAKNELIIMVLWSRGSICSVGYCWLVLIFDGFEVFSLQKTVKQILLCPSEVWTPPNSCFSSLHSTLALRPAADIFRVSHPTLNYIVQHIYIERERSNIIVER